MIPDFKLNLSSRELTDEQASVEILAEVRARGCNCDPDIIVMRSADNYEIHTAHDDWCVLPRVAAGRWN